jgi:hypothetical protein
VICPTRQRLQQEATAVLNTLTELITQQIEALRVGDNQKLLSADKKLEMMFGEKERTFGALRQHTKEHGC